MAGPEIPFQFRDGLIWIQASVAGSEKPLHFLLDSGAQVSVINLATAQRLGIKPGRSVTVEGVDATTTGFWPQRVDARAGGVQLPRRYLLLDLQKLGLACTNAIVDGIIGADFFKHRIVRVDFEQRVLGLLRRVPAEAGAEVLPLKVRECGMLIPVRVNEGPLEWVRLDTGCASALLWVAPKVRPERCVRRVAVGLAPVSLAVTRTVLALGNIGFKNVPTDVQPKEIFPGEKGLLGNGILCRCRAVTIDSKDGRLVVLPPKQSCRSQKQPPADQCVITAR